MSNDVEDMNRQICDLIGDLEHEKDNASFWEKAYYESKEETRLVRAAIVKAIDEIALTDKTRDGLRTLRIARVRARDDMDLEAIASA